MLDAHNPDPQISISILQNVMFDLLILDKMDIRDISVLSLDKMDIRDISVLSLVENKIPRLLFGCSF